MVIEGLQVRNPPLITMLLRVLSSPAEPNHHAIKKCSSLPKSQKMSLFHLKLDFELVLKDDVLKPIIEMKSKRTLADFERARVERDDKERRSKRMKHSARDKAECGLWCSKCERKLPKDSFSQKQRKRRIGDDTRYCLRHSTASDFNRLTPDF